MCNNTDKIQNIKIILKVIESEVQDVYFNGCCLNCKQKSVAAVHLCFHGYAPLSPLVFYSNVNECIMLVHACCVQETWRHIPDN